MGQKKNLIALTIILLLEPAARVMADDAYEVTNLVANNASFNPQIVDPDMINAWGLALRPPGAGGHIWISNERTGTSSEYIGDVPGNPLHQDGLKIVTLDTGSFSDTGYATITGQAYNAASDFLGQVAEFSISGPAHNFTTTPPTSLGISTGSAKFVFATKDGTINAWRTNSASAMDSAKVAIDYSKTAAFPSIYPANPVYTGIAMSTNAVTSSNPVIGNHVYATDFRNNAIEVFDNQWHDVTQGVSTDPNQSYHFQTPASVGDLHPFNVQELQGHLFVAYAKFNPDSDEGFEDIPGFGHIVEYNGDGSLVKDFHDNGILNSPWGMAIAPSTFGTFASKLLVADFGDEGTIAAFDPSTGNFVDYLHDIHGDVLTVDGVWGLAFGNGVSLGDANSLYFTAGPNLEQDGVFGKITLVPEPSSLALLTAVAVLAGRRARRGSSEARGRRSTQR